MSNQSALLLREYDALSSLYSAMPKTIGSSVFSHRQEFTWTCIDVSEEYIAVGTNLGQLFLYDRSKGVIRHQLSSRVDINALLHFYFPVYVSFTSPAGTSQWGICFGFLCLLQCLLPSQQCGKQLQLLL